MGINLSNREAARLFYDWGFEDDPNPGATGGHHYFVWPPTGQRTTITNPGRHTPTPRRAYIKAAEIVGIPLRLFLLGPDKALETANQVVDDLIVEAKAADPLGIKTKAVYAPPATFPPAQEPDMPLTPTDEKVLGAVLDAPEPVTIPQLVQMLGLSESAVKTSLYRQEKAGDLFRVGKGATTTSATSNNKGGRRPLLWWHAATYDPTPATAPAPDPTPEETPVPQSAALRSATADMDRPPVVKTPLVREAEASVALDGETFTVDSTPFERAEHFQLVTVLKPGEFLLKSNSGTLYIARELIERR